MLEHSRRKRRNQNFTKLSKYFVDPNVVNRLGLLPPLIPVELRKPVPAVEPSVSLNAVVEALVITESSPTATTVQEKNNNIDDDHSTVKTYVSASLKSASSVASATRVHRAKSDQLLSQHWQDEDDMSLNSLLSMKSWESSQSRSSVMSRIPVRIIHGKLKARAIIAQRLPPTKPMVVFPRELLEAGDNDGISYSRSGDLEISPSQKQPSSKSSRSIRHRLRRIELVTDTSEITSATTEPLPNKNNVANNLSTELRPKDRDMTKDSSSISSDNTAQKEAAIDVSDIGSVESETKVEKKKTKKVPSFDGPGSTGYKSPTSSGSRLFANTAAAIAKLVKTDHDKTHHEVAEHDEQPQPVKKMFVASLDGASRLLAGIGRVKQETTEEEVYVPKKRKVSNNGRLLSLYYLVVVIYPPNSYLYPSY